MTDPTSSRNERWIIAAVVAIPVLLLIPKAVSELWMDELLSLSLFAQLPALGDVFNRYPIANNHMLFSACGWIWLKLIGNVALGSELLLRVPSVLFVGLSGLVVACGARFGLGRGRALLAAAILGLSPVTQSLGWQFRGYGLSICMGAIAVVGILALLDEKTVVRGRWLAFSALALLPVVVPSNLVLNAAIVIFICWEWQRRSWARSFIPDVVGVVVSAGVGGLVYLRILDQFLQVLRQTNGWSSGWFVAGHWLLALALSALPAAVFYLPAFRKNQEPTPAGESQLLGAAKRLALVALALSLAFALVKAPFPRTLVVFLPALVVGLVAFVPVPDSAVLIRPLSLTFVVGCLMALAFVQLNERDRVAGVRKHDLLRQAYTGSRDWSDVMRALAGSDVVKDGIPVIVPFFDILTAEWYWPSPNGQPPVVCPMKTGAYASRIPPEVMQQRPFVVISPPGEGHLADCAAFVGRPLETQLILESGNLRVFAVRASPAP